MESPALLNSGHQSGNSVLKAVYVSNNGSVEGPWNTIADYRKLGNSGSALKTNNAGKGYGPGVQAWYNNFIEVDPSDPDHVYLGLEEVYESTNGGSTWTTPGPYWNFGFSCWNILESKNTCPETTHSDQHSIAIADGVVYVGNDGGVKARPLAPTASRRTPRATRRTGSTSTRDCAPCSTTRWAWAGPGARWVRRRRRAAGQRRLAAAR